MTPVARALSKRFSIQRDSEILRNRIAQAQRLALLRRNLHYAIKSIAEERRAA